MLDPNMIASEEELLRLLTRLGFHVIPAQTARGWELWQAEWQNHELPLACATSNGSFLAVRNNAFELYVQDARDYWFNLVGVLTGAVTEDTLSDMLDDIMTDTLDRMYYRTRKLGFRRYWQVVLQKWEHPGAASRYLKRLIFSFRETRVEPGDLAQMRVALEALLHFFLKEEARTPLHYYIMRTYFPAKRFEHWNLPPAYRTFLHDFGAVFADAIPASAHIPLSALTKLTHLAERVRELS